tara:strand:+ start:167 stop:670 length:504 start_codon:yes stop_codon:yes gene_type:complete
MVDYEKLFREARMVAVKAHAPQSYADIYPYEKHLDDVIAVLRRYHITAPKYIVAGYLHDVLEDGAISYSKIKTHFGLEVAEMVYCVTDELGRNREEKKRKTLPKTASNPDAVILKLADRIANIEMGGKVGMYKGEYDAFRDALKQPDQLADPMWKDLDVIMGYKVVA